MHPEIRRVGGSINDRGSKMVVSELTAPLRASEWGTKARGGIEDGTSQCECRDMAKPLELANVRYEWISTCEESLLHRGAR